MGKSDSRGQGVQIGAVATLEIDPDILAAFENLPGRIGNTGFNWTKEKDFLLLKYWPIKQQQAVARALGVSRNTARERYRKHIAGSGQCKS